MPATSSTTPRRASTRVVRVVSHNILLGGEGREEAIAAVLQRCDADIVGLQEANDLALAARLAARLGMEMVVGEPSDPASRLNLALLSRLPVVLSANHRHAGMLRTHLAVEVRTGSRAVPRLRVHVVHLAARFGERANGEVRRMREMGAVLDDIAAEPRRPHVILGDFNAVAPGDVVAATDFFARMAALRRAGLLVLGDDGFVTPVIRPDEDDPDHDARWQAEGVHPRLDVGIPRLPWVVGPVTTVLPRHPVTDRLLNLRIRRDTVEHLLDLGYVDCYRCCHDEEGYTVATWMPAARIDYIFADAQLAPRLVDCEVVGSQARPDPQVEVASDHFPLVAEFRL